MVSLRVFLMIVGTLVIRQISKGISGYPVEHALALMTAYCTAFAVVSKFAAVLATVNRSDSQTDSEVHALGAFVSYRRLLELAWIVLLPAALIISGWGGLIEQGADEGRPHAIIFAAWLAPSLVFLALLDLSEAQLILHLNDNTSRRHAENKRTAEPIHNSLDLWLQLLRIGPVGGALLCIVPMLVLVAALDVTRFFVPNLSNGGQAVAAAGLMFLLIVGAAPKWMSLWMGAVRPNDDRTQRRVSNLCRSLRIAGPKVEVIPAGRAWNGAAVVGWSRFNRRLWIGESLFKQLTATELDMVVLHELAHLKRHHAAWRALPIIGSAAIAALLLASSSLWLGSAEAELMDAARRAWLESCVEGATICAAVVGMAWGLGAAAKACEFDADRRACLMAADHCEWAAGRPHRAAAALVAALHNLAGSREELNRASWLHPPCEKRCEELAVFRR
ncbi:MAG: M48 family metalloprotease [Pirellulales bacterium]